MHLPSHIANLNLLAATPAPSSFRPLYPSNAETSPSQGLEDPQLEDSLKEHLDLWINTEFTWADDQVAAAAQLAAHQQSQDDGGKSLKDDEEMGLMDYYKSRIKGGKERNVLLDQKLGLDGVDHSSKGSEGRDQLTNEGVGAKNEQDSAQSEESRSGAATNEQSGQLTGIASFLNQYSSLLSSAPPEFESGSPLSGPLDSNGHEDEAQRIQKAQSAIPPAPINTPTVPQNNHSQPDPNIMALLASHFPQYAQGPHYGMPAEYPPLDLNALFQSTQRGTVNPTAMNGLDTSSFAYQNAVNLPELIRGSFSESAMSSALSKDTHGDRHESSSKKRKSTAGDSEGPSKRKPSSSGWSESGPSPSGEATSLTDGITPEEDKRRRNTAASARFRLKKKEREQAIERHSKELEERLARMDREMESLRKENGWLKALLINGAPRPLSADGPAESTATAVPAGAAQ